MARLEVGIDSRGAKIGGKEVEKALADVDRKAQRTVAQVKTLGTKFKGAFLTMQKAVFSLQGAMLAFGAAFTLKSTLDQFKHFETATVDMGKVTTRNLQGIRKEVMLLPPELGSATELMQGYYQVISAGVKGAENQLQTLITTAQSAIAAHVNQAEVIKGLTSVVDAYGGAVKDAAEASDLLYTIERLGKTNVAELIPVIGSLTSMSAELTIKSNELGAALAQITKYAGSTAEAATQYRAILIALTKPTDKMTKLFKEYGEVQKAITELGFVEVLKRINIATKGSSEALATLLGGRQEALLGFLALAKKGFQGVSENLVEMESKAGATEEAFERWKATFEAVETVFRNTMERLAIEIGEDLAPMAMGFLNNFASWVKGNKTEILSFFQSLFTLIQGIGTAASTVGKLVGWMPQWAADIGAAMGLVSAGVLSLAEVAKTGSPEELRKLIESIDALSALELKRKILLTEQADLQKQVYGGIFYFAKHKERLAEVNKELGRINELIKTFTDQNRKASIANAKLGDQVKSTTDDIKKAGQAVAEFSKEKWEAAKALHAFSGNIAEMEQNFARLQERLKKGVYAISEEEWERRFGVNIDIERWKKAAEAVNAYGGNIAELRQEFTRLQERIDKGVYIISEAEWGKRFAGGKILTEVEKTYEIFFERIQGAWADTFYDIYKDQWEGWEDLLDKMTDLFARTLSEWVAEAAKTKIKTYITTEAMGTGVGTDAPAGAAGGMGYAGIGMAGFALFLANVMIKAHKEAEKKATLRWQAGMGWEENILGERLISSVDVFSKRCDELANQVSENVKKLLGEYGTAIEGLVKGTIAVTNVNLGKLVKSLEVGGEAHAKGRGLGHIASLWIKNFEKGIEGYFKRFLDQTLLPSWKLWIEGTFRDRAVLADIERFGDAFHEAFDVAGPEGVLELWGMVATLMEDIERAIHPEHFEGLIFQLRELNKVYAEQKKLAEAIGVSTQLVGEAHKASVLDLIKEREEGIFTLADFSDRLGDLQSLSTGYATLLGDITRSAEDLRAVGVEWWAAWEAMIRPESYDPGYLAGIEAYHGSLEAWRQFLFGFYQIAPPPEYLGPSTFTEAEWARFNELLGEIPERFVDWFDGWFDPNIMLSSWVDAMPAVVATLEANLAAWGASLTDTTTLIETLHGNLSSMFATTSLDPAVQRLKQELDAIDTLMAEVSLPSSTLSAIQAYRDQLIKGIFAPIQDIIDRHTLTDYELGLKALNEWYAENAVILGVLGLALDDLNYAYDLQKQALEELDDALGSTIKSIDAMIESLTVGAMAPVQSAEYYMAKYAGLLETGKVDELLSFIPTYLDFMKGFGPDYATLTASIVSDLEALKLTIPGLPHGGLTQGLSFAGERGSEWVIPTYEPQRSSFLADVGADPDKIGQAIARHIIPVLVSESDEGREINLTIQIDGREIGHVVAGEMKGRNTELIKATRRAVG